MPKKRNASGKVLPCLFLIDGGYCLESRLLDSLFSHHFLPNCLQVGTSSWICLVEFLAQLSRYPAHDVRRPSRGQKPRGEKTGANRREGKADKDAGPLRDLEAKGMQGKREALRVEGQEQKGAGTERASQMPGERPWCEAASVA